MRMSLKDCLNPKVIVGLAAVAAVIYLVAPGALFAALPLLAVAICPISMFLMMRMMGSNGHGSAGHAAHAGHVASGAGAAGAGESSTHAHSCCDPAAVAQEAPAAPKA